MSEGIIASPNPYAGKMGVESFIYGGTARLNEEGFRVETDFRTEKLGYKLREAQTNKIPYMVVVGDKEAEDGTIALRKRMVGDQGTMTLDAFMEMIRTERDTRSC